LLPVSDTQASNLRSQPSDGRITKPCLNDPMALPMQLGAAEFPLQFFAHQPTRRPRAKTLLLAMIDCRLMDSIC
jgi:hypothetical protein